jgi:hypothetical protein
MHLLEGRAVAQRNAREPAGKVFRGIHEASDCAAPRVDRLGVIANHMREPQR